MRKYLLIPIACLMACDGVPPATSGPTSPGPTTPAGTTTAALYETASSISDLKALTSTTRSANTLYYVKGYNYDGDGGNGLLEWRPSSYAAPDDILVFLPNDLTVASPGRFHQIIENGSFDAKRGGLVALSYDTTEACMATTACVSGDQCCPYNCQNAVPVDPDCHLQGAKLQAIYGAVNTAQISELYISPGRYDVRDGITIGPATNGGHTNIRGAGNSSTTLYGGQGFTGDASHPGQMLLETYVPGGGSTWVQALTAGDKVLHGTGLYMPYPGERVYLELGADNTDQYQPYLVMMTTVASISGTDVTITDPVPETIPPYTNSGHTVANQNTISAVAIPVEGISISDLSTDLLLVAFDKVTNVSMHDCSVKRGTATFSYSNVWNLSLSNIVADHIYGFTLGPPLGTFGSGWYGWFMEGWKAYRLNVSNITIKYLEALPLFTAESQTRDVTLENLHVYSDGGRLLGNSALIVGGNQGVGSSFPATQLIHPSDTIEVKDLHLDLGPGTSGMGGDAVRFENLEINGTSTAIPNFSLNLSAVDGDFKWGGQFFNQRIPFSTYIPLVNGAGTTDYPLPVTGLIGKMRTYASTLTNVSSVAVGYPGTGWVGDYLSELVAGQWVENQLATSTAAGYPNYEIGTKFLRVTTSAAPPAGAYMIVEGESLASDESLATRPATTKAGAGAPTVSADYVGQEYFDYTNSRFYKAVGTGGGSADWVLE